MNEIFNVIKGKNFNYSPIWFMRQAGRYLPEYRKLRSQHNDFISMCYNVEAITEITLQPLKRYNFDAAIIFSDILLLLDNMGLNVNFKNNQGPIVEKISHFNEISKIKDHKKLHSVYEAITKVKNIIPKNKALIGFIGAPWTLLTYLIEQNNKKDFIDTRSFIYNNKILIDALINIIIEENIKHIKGQINAGVDIIQIFDSWSGVLSEDLFYEYVILPTQKIIKSIKKQHNIPIIGFPKGAGYNYYNYITNTNIDIIGVDYTVPLNIMKEFQQKKIVQGNLDPVILLSNNKEIIKKKIDEIIKIMNGNFIFNLGHGILPNTPLENVEFIVNYVQNYKK